MTAEPTTERPTAEVVCRGLEPSAEAKALLRPGLSGDAFLGHLVQKALYKDALHFAAHWLAKREAVWWGCLCAWSVCRPTPAPADAEALRAALQWVREPSEEKRQAAGRAGDAAGGAGTAAGAVALAAFWSGGSLSPPGLPPAPPPPTLTQHTIAGAALLMANMVPRPRYEAACRQFATMAVQVAHKDVSWE